MISDKNVWGRWANGMAKRWMSNQIYIRSNAKAWISTFKNLTEFWWVIRWTWIDEWATNRMIFMYIFPCNEWRSVALWLQLDEIWHMDVPLFTITTMILYHQLHWYLDHWLCVCVLLFSYLKYLIRINQLTLNQRHTIDEIMLKSWDYNFWIIYYEIRSQ